jgi:trigger factor
VPLDEIDKRLDELKAAAGERAAKDLKLYFILDRIAKEEGIEATDAEVDARVRFIAAQYGRRPDRMRAEMDEQGRLDSLRVTIREDKVMRMLMEKAKIAGEETEEEGGGEASEPESGGSETPDAT